MYNWAWVTTANGDINFDGDLYDATYYNDDYLFTQGTSQNYLITDANPGGTWERWPSFGQNNEGHFYMECSNRGVCDRKEGTCECFEGYEGEACRRSKCPNDCSGHGTCETVASLGTYTLWDADMTRVCQCDPGFLGIACDKRYCPFGNDPLTATNEHKQTVFIDIFDTGVTFGTLLPSASTFGPQLGGYATFKYTDHYGESWETSEVAISRFDGTTGTNGAMANLAAAVETALEAVPNDVFTDVQVTTEWCEEAGFGTVALDGATADPAFGAGSTRIGKYYRIPTAGEDNDRVCIVATGVGADRQAVLFDGTTPGTLGTAGNFDGLDAGECKDYASTIFSEITYPNCVRLQIKYTGISGNLNAITADVSKVEIGGMTNAQLETTTVQTSTRTDLKFSTGNFAVNEGAASIAITDGQFTDSKTLLVDGITGAYNAGLGIYAQAVPGSVVSITCEDGGNDVELGTYTIASFTMAGATFANGDSIVLSEATISNACTAANSVLTLTRVSNIISTPENDFTAVGSIVGTGVQIAIETGGGAQTSIPSTILSVSSQYIIVDNFRSSASLRSTSATYTDHAQFSLTTDDSHVFVVDGKGTEENDECSGRGLCDRENGLCQCFKGYRGDSCHTQSALNV